MLWEHKEGQKVACMQMWRGTRQEVMDTGQVWKVAPTGLCPYWSGKWTVDLEEHQDAWAARLWAHEPSKGPIETPHTYSVS